MTFRIIGVCRGVYSYIPREQPDNDEEDDEQEIDFSEDELLFLIEKGEDGWWKVKRTSLRNEGNIGLAPGNYLEELHPVKKSKALYDYTRQSIEEVSFLENEELDVYESNDPDWVLVCRNGEYGFAPWNYLSQETSDKLGNDKDDATASYNADTNQVRSVSEEQKSMLSELRRKYPVVDTSSKSEDHSEHHESQKNEVTVDATSPSDVYGYPESRYALEDSFSESRHHAVPIDFTESSSSKREEKFNKQDTEPAEPPEKPPRPTVKGDEVKRTDSKRQYRTSQRSKNSLEVNKNYSWKVEEVDGKRRKSSGILKIERDLISYSTSDDELELSWPITSIASYSREKKHIFIDLEKPSASFDFHVSSSADAGAIIGRLGTISGALKANGLRDIADASGHPLQDLPSGSAMARNAHSRSTSLETPNVDLARQAADDEMYEIDRRILSKSDKNVDNDHRSYRDYKQSRGNTLKAQRSKDESRSKPDITKVRTWTDRSGNFRVEAEFIGFRDGNVQLHKLNGVKISVPSDKLSIEDMSYIEKLIKKRKEQKNAASQKNQELDIAKIAREQALSREDFDWFDFFLKAGIDVNVCTRYQRQFEKESLSESSLPDLTSAVMRTLGVREGDIIRIRRYLKQKLGKAYNETAYQEGHEAENGRFENEDQMKASQLNDKDGKSPKKSPSDEDKAWKIWPQEKDPQRNLEVSNTIKDLKNLSLKSQESNALYNSAAASLPKPLEPMKRSNPLITGNSIGSLANKNEKQSASVINSGQPVGVPKQTTGIIQQQTGGPFSNIYAIPTGQSIILQQTGYPAALQPVLTGSAPTVINRTGLQPVLTGGAPILSQRSGHLAAPLNANQLTPELQALGTLPYPQPVARTMTGPGNVVTVVPASGPFANQPGFFVHPLQTGGNQIGQTSLPVQYGINSNSLPQTTYGPYQNNFNLMNQPNYVTGSPHGNLNANFTPQNIYYGIPQGWSPAFGINQSNSASYSGAFNTQTNTSAPNLGVASEDVSKFRPVQFGQLEPQKTGRANLYKATPDNPFGFG